MSDHTPLPRSWPRAARALFSALIVTFSLGAGPLARGADGTETFRNPILPGFHPDPSVVRVGDDYYLITSTFEYFPGIPVYHSRDLVHWRQLGYALDRPSQLNLDGAVASGGIYASTIRHHQGTFYVVTTLVQRKPVEKYVNFIVTAKDPAGPWSEPYVVAENFWRIDPSLFFDGDGRAWFVANRRVEPDPYPGHRMISLQELDLRTMKLIGKVYDLGEGHARNAKAPEAPHIYKRGDFYYLLVAEGGTFGNHAVTISRSRAITGPYVQHHDNPILTHRHLGPGLDIHSVGHADMVDTPAGAWWMVALGMRGVGGRCCTLGRETFLTPVSWTGDGWPVVNQGVGRVLATDKRPALPIFDVAAPPAADLFDGDRLAHVWNFVRTPRGQLVSLSQRRGFLRLFPRKTTLADDGNPAYVGRRLQHQDWAVRTKLEFKPRTDGEAAGVALRNGYQYIALMKTRSAGRETLRLLTRTKAGDTTVAEAPAPAGPLSLKVECRREVACAFSYASAPERWTLLGQADGGIVAHGAPGGLFTGAYVGMYATTPGATGAPADFDMFEYQGL
jgi:xylan 1,4-beta-xylosidase